VWALPTPGSADDFGALVELVAGGDPSRGGGAAGALWTIRLKLGARLGWDDADAGLGARVQTLRERLPADLRDAPAGPQPSRLPFSTLYRTEDEWAAELANGTVHGVMHIGWVPDGAGAYRGQMAVLVKPNGWLGECYMAAIRPFRHLVVYPVMLRRIGERWRAGRVAGAARARVGP